MACEPWRLLSMSQVFAQSCVLFMLRTARLPGRPFVTCFMVLTFLKIIIKKTNESFSLRGSLVYPGRRTHSDESGTLDDKKIPPLWNRCFIWWWKWRSQILQVWAGLWRIITASSEMRIYSEFNQPQAEKWLQFSSMRARSQKKDRWPVRFVTTSILSSFEGTVWHPCLSRKRAQSG